MGKTILMKRIGGFFAFFVLMLMLMGITHTYAFDTWHTASGKSYDVYTVAKTEDKPDYYIISYRTTLSLKNKKKLQEEFNDVLAHFYLFRLTDSERKHSKARVAIEAFRGVPSPSTPNDQPTVQRKMTLAELDKIVKKQSYSKDRMRALRANVRSKYKDVISSFEKIKNKTVGDYIQLANAYLYSKKTDKGLKVLEKGSKAFPKDLTLLNNLAMIKLLLGTFEFEGKREYDPEAVEGAKKILAKAQKIDPKSWVTLLNAAHCDYVIGNIKDAERLYLKAYDLNPIHVDVNFRVGNFYHEQKKFVKAGEHYEKVLTYYKNNRYPASHENFKEIKRRLKLVQKKKPIKK